MNDIQLTRFVSLSELKCAADKTLIFDIFDEMIDEMREKRKLLDPRHYEIKLSRELYDFYCSLKWNFESNIKASWYYTDPISTYRYIAIREDDIKTEPDNGRITLVYNKPCVHYDELFCCQSIKDRYDKAVIDKVIFNNPATIVYWADGSKTVVKRRNGDRYDKEKGLAMAIVKKLMGLKEFYKYLEEKK